MKAIRCCLICDTPIPDSKRVDAKYCSDSCGNKKRTKTYRDNHPDRVMQKRLIDNAKVPARIHSRVKCRAKRNNISFNLERSDIIVPTHCPVLGIEIKSVAGGGTNQHSSPSVDRIDPNKGYTKGNVRVISQRANLLKSNAEVWEIKLVLKDLEEIQGGSSS